MWLLSERPADALPNGTRAIELHQFVADAAGAPYAGEGDHGGAASASASAGKTWYLVTVLFEMNFATYEWRKVRMVAFCEGILPMRCSCRKAQPFFLAGYACFFVLFLLWIVKSKGS